uniref:Uncharacterized protein n=1 Tax=Globodera rostochiensis TaxID=31243 RepID=A0A914I279_GLORO
MLALNRPALNRVRAQELNLNNYEYAKTGAKLHGGLTIPLDDQIRIEPSEIRYDTKIRILVLNAVDGNLKMTVVGGPSCRSVFMQARHCDLGKENDVCREHLPKECTDPSGCKEFSFTCTFPTQRVSSLPDALVFEVDLFAFREAYQKCTWRAYIDGGRLLLDKYETNGRNWTWAIAFAKLFLFSVQWLIIIYCAFKPPSPDQPPAQFPRPGRLQDRFHE